ncbi:MAG TPA: ABC transporter substrate-binding protein, partial [Acidimicrobiales bacterium]|nr:ABC transporter substrate-binding protein [Acidimicrobiales bacterium]
GVGGALVLDPAAASLADPAGQLVADLLYDGLTELDDEGVARPALATAWTVDEAFETWRFTLDEARTFASGRPVTATEVVGSLQHVIAGGDASLAALRLEDVQGFRAYLDGAAPTVAGLRALDARTVEIALATPLAILPELLAAPSYGITATPGTVPPPTDLDLSGAWAVRSAQADGSAVELARREGSAAHLEGIELRAHADAAEAYTAFEDGDVDWAPVPVERFGDAVGAYGDDHFAPFQAELFFGLRADAPGLDKRQLRQAIAAAIDREAIVRAVYPDLADPLDAVVPVGVPGRAADSCAACDRDVVRARRLLAEGFPDGNIPTVAIDYDASPAQEAMAKTVADQLGAVGITTTQRAMPLPDYQRFIVQGGQQLFSFGWIGGYASPDAYLSPLFRSTSNDNLVALRSADVDYLLGQARAQADPAARAELWAEAQRFVLDEAFVVPIAQFRTQVVVADRVEALVHRVDGTVRWSDVWLADAGTR